MRLALVGASNNLKNFDISFFKKLKIEPRYLVTNSSKEYFENIKKKFNITVLNYSDFFNTNDYDVAYICNKETNRFEVIFNLLKKKKICILEKNFLLDEIKEKELFKLAEYNNTKIYQSLVTKYHPQYKFIKTILAKIGSIKHINIFLFNYLNDKNNFRLNDPHCGGIVNDYLQYILSILSWLNSDKIVHHSLYLNKNISSTISTSMKLNLSYLNGTSAFIYADYNIPFKKNECEIIGDNGIIKLFHPITYDSKCRIMLGIKKNIFQNKISILKNKIFPKSKYFNNSLDLNHIIINDEAPMQVMFSEIVNSNEKKYHSDLCMFNNLELFYKIRRECINY